MIISASRRTDIPAFYSRWFMQRLREGFTDIINPFNPAQRRRVDFRPEAVEAIAFWTRFPAPLFQHLPEMDRRGYRYYFLYTITGYPKEIEPNLPSLDHTISTFRKLSQMIGPDRVVWRYDPIILSSITDADYHICNFENIARQLAGATRRVKVSFLDFYRKTDRRLSQLSDETGIQWIQTDDRSQIAFIETLNQIAQSNGIIIQSCAEETDLQWAEIRPGSCIDYDLINKVFSLALPYCRDLSQRKACLCGQSVDIGAYNTCGFRCAYCYATSSFEASARHLKSFDCNSTSLSPILRKTYEEAQTTNPSPQKN